MRKIAIMVLCICGVIYLNTSCQTPDEYGDYQCKCTINHNDTAFTNETQQYNGMKKYMAKQNCYGYEKTLIQIYGQSQTNATVSCTFE